MHRLEKNRKTLWCMLLESVVDTLLAVVILRCLAFTVWQPINPDNGYL